MPILKGSGKPVNVFLGLFIVVTLAGLAFRQPLRKAGVDTDVVIAANLILLLVSLITHRFHQQAMKAGNTAAFLRQVYMAIFLKLAVCGLAFFLYAYLSPKVNTPALLIGVALYFIYTFVDVGRLRRPS